MRVAYTNNLKRAYLEIISDNYSEEDFQLWMLQQNEIPGLLDTHIIYLDEECRYQYDISGKISLQSAHEKVKLSGKDIKEIVNALLDTLQEIRKYMLDGTKLMLEPEFIFVEKDKYYFCFCPALEAELTEEFHKLTEYFVREVDYQDKEGVELAYVLHKETMEENYSIEKIMAEVLHPKEEKAEIRYEEIAEEEKDENNVVAESEELWEPVRKLLERKKKEKWGYWDEIHIEEEIL